MFTLLIGKKPVAVIDAPESDARELLEQDEFHEDLGELMSEGKPLWNGREKLTLRPSTEEEVQEFEQGAFDDDDEEDDEELLEGATVYFLVPIDDDEDEDEEDAG